MRHSASTTRPRLLLVGPFSADRGRQSARAASPHRPDPAPPVLRAHPLPRPSPALSRERSAWPSPRPGRAEPGLARACLWVQGSLKGPHTRVGERRQHHPRAIPPPGPGPEQSSGNFTSNKMIKIGQCQARLT